MSCASTGCGGGGAGINTLGFGKGQTFIRLHPSDQVVVVTQPTPKGTKLTIDGQLLEVRNDVPAGHKLATTEIAVDTPVFSRFGKRLHPCHSDQRCAFVF